MSVLDYVIDPTCLLLGLKVGLLQQGCQGGGEGHGHGRDQVLPRPYLLGQGGWGRSRGTSLGSSWLEHCFTIVLGLGYL